MCSVYDLPLLVIAACMDLYGLAMNRSMGDRDSYVFRVRSAQLTASCMERELLFLASCVRLLGGHFVTFL